MKIGVIGGGAIGLLISNYLSNKHEVTLFVRRHRQFNDLKNKGITLIIDNEEMTSVNVQISQLTNGIEMDLWIVAVKQYQLNEVVEYIPFNSQVIFVQNGMSHIELLNKWDHSYVGIVEHGASKINDIAVKHLGKGKINIGSITNHHHKVNSLVAELHHRDFPFVKNDNWELSLKEKLIVNAVINPLTALFDVKNAQILNNKYIHQLAKYIFDEAALVLQLNSHSYWKKVIQIAENTGDNTSSMRADIQKKRRTEIDAITGYILHQSEKPLPYNQFIYDAIRALEERHKND